MKWLIPALTLMLVACSNTPPPPAGPLGTLAGTVSLSCDDQPCTQSNPYAHRPVQIQTEFGELLHEVTPFENGSYSIELPPGKYYVDIPPYGLDRVRGVPKYVTVEENKTTTLDVAIAAPAD